MATLPNQLISLVDWHNIFFETGCNLEKLGYEKGRAALINIEEKQRVNLTHDQQNTRCHSFIPLMHFYGLY